MTRLIAARRKQVSHPRRQCPCFGDQQCWPFVALVSPDAAFLTLAPILGFVFAVFVVALLLMLMLLLFVVVDDDGVVCIYRLASDAESCIHCVRQDARAVPTREPITVDCS